MSTRYSDLISLFELIKLFLDLLSEYGRYLYDNRTYLLELNELYTGLMFL